MFLFREFNFQQRIPRIFYLKSWKLACDKDLGKRVLEVSKSKLNLTQIYNTWEPTMSEVLCWAQLGDDVYAETSGAVENLLLIGWICFMKPSPWQQGSTCRELQLTLKISPLSRYSKLHSVTHGGFLFLASCWIICWANIEHSRGSKVTEMPYEGENMFMKAEMIDLQNDLLRIWGSTSEVNKYSPPAFRSQLLV